MRTGESPITTLTGVSQAFNRLNRKLFTRKLLDLGLPRQLRDLVIEFISGIRVSLCWGGVQTDLLERGDIGAPQGSLEGMCNFGVYADNIHSQISKVVTGIDVGSVRIRDVVYADDITLVNNSPRETNLGLNAVCEAGAFDAFKFKAEKCKIIGVEDDDPTIFRMGDEEIKRAPTGILLGAVINSRGLDVLAHVKRRAKMVGNGIVQLKSWRTEGLPYDVTFNQLFKAKILPRFSYAFALFPYAKWGTAHSLIQRTLGKALENACGWHLPKVIYLPPATWFAVCGFPPVLSFLRKLKLEFAARLKLAEHRAGIIFKVLLEEKKGVLVTDATTAVEEWLLGKLWGNLSDNTLFGFKKKVRKLAKRNWPHGLPREGCHKWLYHNHSVYSGNVPAWANWEWPGSTNWKMGRFECHFYCLVIGCHPAFGGNGACQRLGCQGRKNESLYEHHFFKCESSCSNREYFKEKVYTIFGASNTYGLSILVLDDLLKIPSTIWIGLIDARLFDSGLKIKQVHELHRILTTASILSWGRFYNCPLLT